MQGAVNLPQSSFATQRNHLFTQVNVVRSIQSITLLGSFLDPAVEAIFQSVFTYYYLDLVATVTQSKSFVFHSLGSSFLVHQCEARPLSANCCSLPPAYADISSRIERTKQNAVKKLNEAIKSKPHFLHQFVGFFGHRSARVSSFFQFIFVRLMHMAVRFPVIKEHLVTLDIVNKIRELARSRFSHVQVRMTVFIFTLPLCSDTSTCALTPSVCCSTE
jgi:hypothetical protein